MRWRVAALGWWTLASTSGCALLASANAHHNSRGTACVESPLPALIDLLIAGGTAAAVVGADDTSRWWIALPVAFGTIGVVGTVFALSCRGDFDDQEPATAVTPATNTAPAFGEAPIDPEAREPSFEERVPPSRPSPLFDRTGVPAGPDVAEPPAATPEPEPHPPPPRRVTDPVPAPRCTLTPRVDCPDGYYCFLVAENTGTCVKI